MLSALARLTTTRLLIPALLSLGGRAAWWAPAPLRSLHRRFGVREELAGRAPDGSRGERPHDDTPEPLVEGGRA
jgi:RND superfamily putative drug exporter